MGTFMTEYCELCGSYMYGDGSRIDIGQGVAAWACQQCKDDTKQRRDSTMTRINKWAIKAIKKCLLLAGVRDKKAPLPPCFLALANQIIAERRTMLGIDRLYMLWQCVMNAPAGSNVLEVGVYKGGSAAFLAWTLVHRGNGGHLVAADTFTGHAVVDPSVDGAHEVNKGFADVDFEDVRTYLTHVPTVTVVKGDITKAWISLGKERDLGFVHVDVDVYPATLAALRYAENRLLPGGTIICDDYGFTTCRGVRKAVDEFIAENVGWQKLDLGTGQVLIRKVLEGIH